MNLFFNILSLFNLAILLVLAYFSYKKYCQSSLNDKSKSDSIISGSTKIKLVRFNPFNEVGGDQSFILSILDNQDSGVIITSLHNRDFTRVYAKAIKNGQPDNVVLSKEEKSALKLTVNISNRNESKN